MRLHLSQTSGGGATFKLSFDIKLIRSKASGLCEPPHPSVRALLKKSAAFAACLKIEVVEWRDDGQVSSRDRAGVLPIFIDRCALCRAKLAGALGVRIAPALSTSAAVCSASKRGASRRRRRGAVFDSMIGKIGDAVLDRLVEPRDAIIDAGRDAWRRGRRTTPDIRLDRNARVSAYRLRAIAFGKINKACRAMMRRQRFRL